MFLAFRTTMFEQPNEHITLKFFGDYPEWNEVMKEAGKWQSRLPLNVRQVGLGVWKNKDFYHKVAHMHLIGHPSLFGRSWHVTLESSVNPIMHEPYIECEEIPSRETMRELWVGYKTPTGEKKWIKYLDTNRHMKVGN